MIIKGNNLNKPHNSVITYILCYVYVKFNIMEEEDTIVTILKVIFLIGIIGLLFWLSSGKNITYKSKGVYEISR